MNLKYPLCLALLATGYACAVEQGADDHGNKQEEKKSPGKHVAFAPGTEFIEYEKNTVVEGAQTEEQIDTLKGRMAVKQQKKKEHNQKIEYNKKMRNNISTDEPQHKAEHLIDFEQRTKKISTILFACCAFYIISYVSYGK